MGTDNTTFLDIYNQSPLDFGLAGAGDWIVITILTLLLFVLLYVFSKRTHKDAAQTRHFLFSGVITVVIMGLMALSIVAYDDDAKTDDIASVYHEQLYPEYNVYRAEVPDTETVDLDQWIAQVLNEHNGDATVRVATGVDSIHVYGIQEIDGTVNLYTVEETDENSPDPQELTEPVSEETAVVQELCQHSEDCIFEKDDD